MVAGTAGVAMPLPSQPEEIHAMTSQDRTRLIDQYAGGPAVVAEALAGFPADQLTAHPIPGKWSAAEIAHHLADSETIAAARIRMLIAEDHPAIHAYSPDAYAAALRYETRDIGPALDTLRAVRAGTTQILRTLTDAEWLREGTHPEYGAYSAAKWLTVYAEHAHKHAGQIRRLKEALVGAR
jgi:hypothetical protein